MTIARYATGLALLALLLGGTAAAAVGVRRRLLPGWRGADARLAEAIAGLAVALGVSTVLGTVGLFRAGPVVVVLVLVGAGLLWWPRRMCGENGSYGARITAHSSGGGGLAAAVAATVVLGQWLAHALVSFDRGMLDGDTLWYHGPFAARFVQSGWVTRLHFTNPEPLVTFFPANAELVTALGILPFDRDLLSPLLNAGWLLLALLAGWCVSGPAGLCGAAVVLGLPVMAATQAGTGRNDVVGVALLLAAAALLRRATDDRGAALLAGVAAGLAAGVKVSLLAPVGLLAVAALVVLGRGRRLAFAAALAVTGSVWYVRNLVATGNPLPWLGPLPTPPLPEADVGGNMIVNRLGDPGVLGDVFRPGLHTAFGPLWVVVLALALAGGVLVLRRGRDRVDRALGAVALLAAAAYLVTPNSAAGGGPDADPVLRLALFFLNTRYLTPALALGLVLLPLVASRRVVAWLAVAVLVVNQFPRGMQRGFEWPLPAWAVVAGLGLGAIVTAAVWLGRRHPRPVLAGAALLVAVAGLPAARAYLDGRYTGDPVDLPASPAYAWAAGVSDARIAMSGDFFQYPFAGTDVSNHVQYVGRRGPHGAFRDVDSCEEWRQALADGGYDHVVVAPPAFVPEAAEARAWTEQDPAATVVLSAPTVDVFRLDGPLDPAGC